MRDNDSEIVREQLTRKKIKFNIFLFRQKLNWNERRKVANRMRTNANAAASGDDEWRRRDSAPTMADIGAGQWASQPAEPAKLSRWRSLTGWGGKRGKKGAAATHKTFYIVLFRFLLLHCWVEGRGIAAGRWAGRASVHSNASAHDLAILALDAEAAEWKWQPKAVHLNLKRTDKVQNTYVCIHVCMHIYSVSFNFILIITFSACVVCVCATIQK